MVGVGASQQQNTRSTAANDKAAVAELYCHLDAVTGRLGELSPETVAGFAQHGQRLFQAIELEALAAMRKANPGLAKDVKDGELGEEHLDALATASEKSGGDAATDPTLIGELKDTKPDDANKVTQKWLERRENSTETRYQRQRDKRAVMFGHDKLTGCDTLNARGDSETIRELKKRLEARADEMYKADGGRDLPADKHPRTHHQRMFDALSELLGTNTADGNAGKAGSRTRDASPRAPHPKAMLHVFLTVDDNDETIIRAAALDGDGYLPDTVLERYGCNATIAGTVFNQKGETLWHGRHKRYATPAQFGALIARDHGCVLCGADPSRCEAHHLVPWHAPAKGKTNIDDLAFVCTGCHHWIHDNHRTLIWKHAPPDRGSPVDERRLPGHSRNTGTPPSRTWTTRPATPEEIAPTGPPGATPARPNAA